MKRPRKDGRCTECLGDRPMLAVLDGDPFCSTECCKAFHGVPIAGRLNAKAAA